MQTKLASAIPLIPQPRTSPRQFRHRLPLSTRDVAAADLLRALGVLQELRDGTPLPAEDLDTLAREAGIDVKELWWHIAAGVRAGTIAVDEEHALGLTPQGRAWWRAQYIDW